MAEMFISNKYLRRGEDQDVEWGYCFDVHLNAFFPMLILLHVILPLIFSGLVDYPYFISRLIGNAVWFFACVYYVYITFLGYTAL
uniref:UNC-50 family protein n=1 Tax=Panagrolaimus sp. PS1159 TaxID=55785 RepID=A0AC35ER54_9BILA